MRGRSKSHVDSPDRRSPTKKAPIPAAPAFSRKKLWCFRLLAAVGVPMVCVSLLELSLRLSGYGYPTEFLLPDSHFGRRTLVQNNQFGWRFFGPELARQPCPLAIAPKPGPDTVRIIVFGESAAKGDPDPHFGLPRMLEATLELRHPGVQFEVVNAAMTAINSHAVLPIVRDCTVLDADVWVIYMGNNEVVGPFGAGTVFGSQSPPLALVRSSLALKTTRTGQLLDAAIQQLRKNPAHIPEWGGMEMFLNQQVRADDVRMEGVYRHFERNLADMLRLGQRRGVGIVLSTVAVNLKDCAPFASAHRAELSASDQATWDKSYQLGIDAQNLDRLEEAIARFAEAARVDDTYAELRFRQGQCALALGNAAGAQEHFRAARDLDTLRFRCDSKLNALTRNAGSNREPDRILLADAERIFAMESADGLPGEDLFYEHVHLKFEGNHLLARSIGEQVEQLLSKRLTARGAAPETWPTHEDCARRLGWTDWSRRAGWRGVLPRLRNPPFNGQFDHAFRRMRVEAVLSELATATSPGGISNALAVCEAALESAPSDPALHSQAASLKLAAGDFAGARAAARRHLEILPSDAEGWSQLGLILVRLRQFGEAVGAFECAARLDTRNVAAMEHLAQTWAATGQHEEALRNFDRALKLKPNLALAWLNKGQLLERLKQSAEAANCYQQALANSGGSLSSLLEIAGFCQNRGWYEAAATNYMAAIQWDSSNPELHVGVGQNLTALGRHDEAARYSLEAIRLSPDSAEAHLLYGLILGRQGQIPQAASQFRRALQLKPELLDARINLGVALMSENPAEALVVFEEVLRQSPTNAIALHHVQSLRARLTQPSR